MTNFQASYLLNNYDWVHERVREADGRMTGNHWATLLFVAQWSNKNGEALPPQSKVAAMVGHSQNSVKDLYKHLVEWKLLQRSDHGDYSLHPEVMSEIQWWHDVRYYARYTDDDKTKRAAWDKKAREKQGIPPDAQAEEKPKRQLAIVPSEAPGESTPDPFQLFLKEDAKMIRRALADMGVSAITTPAEVLKCEGDEGVWEWWRSYGGDSFRAIPALEAAIKDAFSSWEVSGFDHPSQIPAIRNVLVEAGALSCDERLKRVIFPSSGLTDEAAAIIEDYNLSLHQNY
jgi:hypothetical protein